jgi:hypothetical protein
MKKNPYLEPTNYMEGYKESLDNFLNSRDRLELDQLMYHVFGKSDDGKKLLEIFKDRFIYAPTPGNLSGNFDHSCIYHEGYRAAFRYIISMVESYKVRKEFEAKEASSQVNKEVSK